MDIQKQFYELVSGQKTGITAACCRCMLGVLALPYRAAVSARNVLYDKRILPIRQSSVPVISVGNLTLGGTGKSPMVAWLCRFLLERGIRPGLISRGYRKGTNEGNDEFMEMSLRFPEIPHIQHPHRAEAIQKLLQRETVDLIVLDDAFQHRQVARNVDIVLLDATSPFGFGHVFPRGTLREPIGSVRRADMALLTRSDLVDPEERQRIRRKILEIHPNIIWGETVHVPTSLISIENFRHESIESMSGQSALAFCGIGNPAAFRKTLEQCGIHAADLISFPDHYRYTAEDSRKLVHLAKEHGADFLLCTMKDLVKLSPTDFSDFPLRAVSVEIEFTEGEERVVSCLVNL